MTCQVLRSFSSRYIRRIFCVNEVWYLCRPYTDESFLFFWNVLSCPEHERSHLQFYLCKKYNFFYETLLILNPLVPFQGPSITDFYHRDCLFIDKFQSDPCIFHISWIFVLFGGLDLYEMFVVMVHGSNSRYGRTKNLNLTFFDFSMELTADS